MDATNVEEDLAEELEEDEEDEEVEDEESRGGREL